MNRTKRLPNLLSLKETMRKNTLLLKTVFLLTVTLWSAKCEQTDDTLHKTVETENGAVRGKVLTTLIENKEYYAFKGIPYAKPPIGDLRFKVMKSQ